MSDGYEADFIQRNGTWLLSMLGIVSACISGLLMYFLKSRCSRIKCCGNECERDVLDLGNVTVPVPVPTGSTLTGNRFNVATSSELA